MRNAGRCVSRCLSFSLVIGRFVQEAAERAAKTAEDEGAGKKKDAELESDEEYVLCCKPTKTSLLHDEVHAYDLCAS